MSSNVNKLNTLLNLFWDDWSPVFWKRLGVILTDVNKKVNTKKKKGSDAPEPSTGPQILMIPDLDAYANAKNCRKKGLVPQPSPPEVEEGQPKPNMKELYNRARYDALVVVFLTSLAGFPELENHYVDKAAFFTLFRTLLSSDEFYQAHSKTFLNGAKKFLQTLGKMCKTRDEILAPLYKQVWRFNPELLEKLKMPLNDSDTVTNQDRWGKEFIVASQLASTDPTISDWAEKGVRFLCFDGFTSDSYERLWLINTTTTDEEQILALCSNVLPLKDFSKELMLGNYSINKFFQITPDDIFRMLFDKKDPERIAFQRASLSLYVTQPTFKCLCGTYKLNDELNMPDVDELKLQNMSDGMLSGYSTVRYVIGQSNDGEDIVEELRKNVLMLANYDGEIGNVSLKTYWMSFCELEKCLPFMYYDQFEWTEISCADFLHQAMRYVEIFRKIMR